MKKIISKILIIFIVVIMLFEFTFSSNVSYAFDSEDYNAITNLIGGLVSFVLWIPRLIITGLTYVMGGIMTESVAECCGTKPGFPDSLLDCATPFDIFFNKYVFLDVNFFDFDLNQTNQGIIYAVRVKVAEWFYVLRTISAAILLVILIYVGIRMAISTIASDKAKYSKMLWDWCCSLALIFVLQYIIIFTIEANNVIVNALREAGYNDIGTAIKGIRNQATGPMGIGALVSTFVYCMIVFQTIAFMLVYVQRMLKVGFLILISPLISITYSIDKIGDGKAQALNKWLKEFIYTILIQPFHCIMYLAFVNTAMKLLGGQITIPDILSGGLKDAISSFNDMNQLVNGFLAILCLKFINDGEKAIRKIFNFQDDGNMTSLAAGAAIGMAAITNAKKIGATTAKGINMAKGGVAKFGKAIGNDSSKFRQSKIGQSISNGMNKVGEKAGQLSDAFKGTKIGQGLGSMYNSANKIAGNIGNFVGDKAQKVSNRFEQFKKGHPKFIKGAKTLGNGIGKGAKFVGRNGVKAYKLAKKAAKRSMPLALGMMGAAMSYATGSSGAMEAIGVGSGLHKGAEEFFASTTGTMAEEKAGLAQRAAEMAYEKQKYEMDTADDAIREKEAQMSGKEDPPEKKESEIQAMVNDQSQIDAWNAKIKEEPLPEPPELSDDASDEEKAKAEEMREAKQRQDDEKELAQLYLNRQKLGERPESKEAFVEAYLSEKNIEGMSRTASHKKEDIEGKKNVLLQKIAELKAEQRRKNGQVDNDTENVLTNDDVSSADRAMKSITDSIDRSVIGSGGNMDISRILQRSLGLQDDGSEQYQAIMRAALDYRQTSIAAAADDIDGRAANLGIEDDALNRSAHRRATSVKG